MFSPISWCHKRSLVIGFMLTNERLQNRVTSNSRSLEVGGRSLWNLAVSARKQYSPSAKSERELFVAVPSCAPVMGSCVDYTVYLATRCLIAVPVTMYSTSFNPWFSWLPTAHDTMSKKARVSKPAHPSLLQASGYSMAQPHSEAEAAVDA